MENSDQVCDDCVRDVLHVSLAVFHRHLLLASLWVSRQLPSHDLTLNYFQPKLNQIFTDVRPRLS